MNAPLTATATCPHCNGSGSYYGSCDTCGGSGVVPTALPYAYERYEDDGAGRMEAVLYGVDEEGEVELDTECNAGDWAGEVRWLNAHPDELRDAIEDVRMVGRPLSARTEETT